jgi:hypothetical protein
MANSHYRGSDYRTRFNQTCKVQHIETNLRSQNLSSNEPQQVSALLQDEPKVTDLRSFLI